MIFATKCLYDNHSILPTVADAHDNKVVGNLMIFTEMTTKQSILLQERINDLRGDILDYQNKLKKSKQGTHIAAKLEEMITEHETEMKIVEKAVLDLQIFKQSLCQTMQQNLTKAFETA